MARVTASTFSTFTPSSSTNRSSQALASGPTIRVMLLVPLPGVTVACTRSRFTAKRAMMLKREGWLGPSKLSTRRTLTRTCRLSGALSGSSARGSSRSAPSIRAKAAAVSSGTSICRRWRLASVVLSSRPVISQIRRRWLIRPISTDSITRVEARLKSHSAAPDSMVRSKMPFQMKPAMSTATNQAIRMRTIRSRLGNTSDTAASGVPWRITGPSPEGRGAATEPAMRRRNGAVPARIRQPPGRAIRLPRGCRTRA